MYNNMSFKEEFPDDMIEGSPINCENILYRFISHSCRVSN